MKLTGFFKSRVVPAASVAVVVLVLSVVLAAGHPDEFDGGDGDVLTGRELLALAQEAVQGEVDVDLPVTLGRVIDLDSIAAVVTNSPWCLVDENSVVDLRIPPDIPPEDASLGLTRLILTEPSWSLADVHRAVGMLGNTHDPARIDYLVFLRGQAGTIVASRSAELARSVSPREYPELEAFLLGEVADLQRSIANALPGPQ